MWPHLKIPADFADLWSAALQAATQLALGLYTAYNLAATAVSFPAGRLADRLGGRDRCWSLSPAWSQGL